MVRFEWISACVDHDVEPDDEMDLSRTISRNAAVQKAAEDAARYLAAQKEAARQRVAALHKGVKGKSAGLGENEASDIKLAVQPQNKSSDIKLGVRHPGGQIKLTVNSSISVKQLLKTVEEKLRCNKLCLMPLPDVSFQNELSSLSEAGLCSGHMIVVGPAKRTQRPKTASALNKLPIFMHKFNDLNSPARLHQTHASIA